MKEQCSALREYSEKDSTLPIEFIQTSSFIKKGNGDLKRRRQKIDYKDIKLERSNYIQEIIRISNKNQGEAITDDVQSDKQSTWNKTHYTTFKRKRIFNPYSQSEEMINSNNYYYHSPLSKSSNSKCSHFKSSNKKESNTNKDNKQQSIDLFKNALLNQELFIKNSHSFRDKYNNSQSKSNTITSRDIELQQLKLIKNEIETMIKLKLDTNENQINISAPNDHFHLMNSRQKDEHRNNMQTSRRSLPNEKNCFYSETILNTKGNTWESNCSNANLKGKKDDIDLKRIKGLIHNTNSNNYTADNNNMKINQRYSQSINCRDSVEDIHKQIDQKYKAQEQPILKGQNRSLKTKEENKDKLPPEENSLNKGKENIKEINNNHGYHSPFKDKHDNMANIKCYKTNTSGREISNNNNNINGDSSKEDSQENKNDSIENNDLINKNKPNNMSRSLINTINNNLSNNSIIDNEKKIEKIISNNIKKTNINESKANQAPEKNDEQFIDSKGNCYTVSDLYRIIERTHQMTLKSKRHQPFNDADYSKAILFLNKSKQQNHQNTSNPLRETKSKIISSIEQSIESNKIFNSKLFSALNQLKGELFNQQKGFIQNKIAPASLLTTSQLKSHNLPLTSRSQTKDKHIKENQLKEEIFDYDTTFSRSHLRHRKPLSFNTDGLFSSRKDKIQTSNQSDYYLSKVKRDIENYSSQKYFSENHSITSRTLRESQNNVTTEMNKFKKNHFRVMPTNDLNMNYFLS